MVDPRVFSAMQTGEPVAVYKKTTLGKVSVTVLSPFSSQPEGVILEGEPKTDERAKIEVWSEMEDVFFKRMNKVFLEKGVIIRTTKEPQKIEPRTIEQYSDEELLEVLNQRYVLFQKELSKTNSEAVVYRLLTLAREEEKSEKIITALEAKLSSLQAK